jgi:Uma2 family endonuclease
MGVSFETYERVALEDGDGTWELVCGRLRAKPIMTVKHNLIARGLVIRVSSQIDLKQYTVGESAAVRIPGGSYLVPDVTVVPMEAARRRDQQHPTSLEIYEEPLPLLVEVWSPSTGEYDVEEKLAFYQLRGDAEIWRIHPYERTLTVWRLQSDGSYAETLYREGIVSIHSLPGVVIDVAELFE